MNTFDNTLTIAEKRWNVHDVLPMIGSICAEHGHYNLDQPDFDWFPGTDDWKLVVDWIGDFGETYPEGWEGWDYDRQDDFIEALAKDYVGNHEPLTSQPDPDFWAKIQEAYGKYGIVVEVE